MTEESDLDIAVILPDHEDPKEFRKKIPRPISSWPLDLLIVNQSRFDARKKIGGVLMDIDQEGIEIYPLWKVNHKS